MAGKSMCEVVCLLSSFTNEEKKTYFRYIKALPNGRTIRSSVYDADCTVIISNTPNRGEKFLCGCISGKPVLTPGYITSSLEKKRWLPKTKFEWCNQKASTHEEKLLISLSTRCKSFAAKHNGRLIFEDWKVLLHIPEKTKRAAYKRLLEAGGAKIINLAPPFHVQLQYVINYAFATKESVKDLMLLSQQQFGNILYPEYISEYLIYIEAEEVSMSTYRHFKKVATPKKATPIKQRAITQMLSKKRKSDESSPSRKKLCFSSDITTTSSSSSSSRVQDACDVAVVNHSMSNFTISSVPALKHPRYSLNNYSSPVPSKQKINDRTPFFSPSGLRIPPDSVKNSVSPLLKVFSPASSSTVVSPQLNPVADTDENLLIDVTVKNIVSKFSLDDIDICEDKHPEDDVPLSTGDDLKTGLLVKETIEGILEKTATRLVTSLLPTTEVQIRQVPIVSSDSDNYILEKIKQPIKDLALNEEPELLTIDDDSLDMPESMVSCPIIPLKNVQPNVESTADNLQESGPSENTSKLLITEEQKISEDNAVDNNDNVCGFSESKLQKTAHSNDSQQYFTIDEDSLDLQDSMVFCPIVDKKPDIKSSETEDSSNIENETKDVVSCMDTPNNIVSPVKNSYLVKEPQYFTIDEDSLDLPDSMVLCPIVAKKEKPNVDISKLTTDTSDDLEEEKSITNPCINEISVATKSSVKTKEIVENSQFVAIDDNSEDFLNSMVCCPILDAKSETKEQDTLKVSFLDAEPVVVTANCTSSILKCSSKDRDPPFLLDDDSLDDLPECFVSCPNVKKSNASSMITISNPPTTSTISTLIFQKTASVSTTSTNLSKKLTSKSFFFENNKKKKNEKSAHAKPILIDDSPLKKFVPQNKQVMCIDLSSDDDKDLVQDIDKDPNVILLLNTPKKKDASSVQCITLDTPEKKTEDNKNNSYKSYHNSVLSNNGMLVHPSASLKRFPVNDKRDVAHVGDINDNQVYFHTQIDLSTSDSNESRIEGENVFLGVESNTPSAYVTRKPNEKLNKVKKKITDENRKLFDDGHDKSWLGLSDMVDNLLKDRVDSDNSSANNKSVNRSTSNISPGHSKKEASKELKSYSLRNKTLDDKKTTLQDDFSDPPINGISGANTNCSTPKNRKSTTPTRLSSKTRKGSTPNKVSSSSSVSSIHKIKKEDPSESLLKTPTKSSNKKKQSCISFVKSPSKFDAIKKEFEELKVKEEPERSPKTSKSRFGRERKHKKFSSDYVTPSSKKKPKFDKNSIIRFMKGSLKENNVSSELESTCSTSSRDFLNASDHSSLKKDSFSEIDDCIAIVQNDSTKELNINKLTNSLNEYPKLSKSKKTSVNNIGKCSKASLNVPKPDFKTLISSLITDTASTKSVSSSDKVSSPDKSPKNCQRSSRRKVIKEVETVDFQKSSIPMNVDSQNSLLSPNEALDSQNALVKKINTQDYFNYLPRLKIDRFIRPDSQSRILERASFPRAIENMVEAYQDQGKTKDALRTATENTSSFFYPKAKTIGIMFHNLFTISNDSQSILESAAITGFLYNLVLLHPVQEITDTLYLALQKPIEDDDENVVGSVLPIEYILEIVSDISDSLKVDPEDRSKDYRGQILLLEYIVHIIQRNFLEHFSDQSLDPIPCKNLCLEKLRKTLIWRVLWGTCKDPVVNKNVRDLIDVSFDVLTDSESDKDNVISQSLITLISLAASCCSIKDTIHTGNGYSTCSTNITAELCAKTEQVLFCVDVKLSTKSWFLKQISPSWLCYRLLENLLVRYSEELVDVSKKHLLRKSLTVEKIIHCYFFLLPRLSDSSKKAAKNTPLKDIKNVINRKTNSPSPKKAVKAKINKKNIRGETQLQVACIKNNPEKVKELLSLGADPNSKDNAGWTPLHEACNYGFVGCVEELLKSKELDIYATNSEGISVLHDAVQNNHVTIVEKLVERGGKKLLKLKTKANLTVFELAPTLELKDMLVKLSGRITPINNSNSRKHNSSFNIEVKLKTEIYMNIETVSKGDIEEYLYLLMMLLNVYLPHSQKTIDPLVLYGQVKLLKEHVNLIGGLSIRSKMLLRSISLIIAPDYV